MNYHNLARCFFLNSVHSRTPSEFYPDNFFLPPLLFPPCPLFQPRQPFSKKPSNEGFSLMNERHPYLGMQTQLYCAWYTRRRDTTASRHFGMSAHTHTQSLALLSEWINRFMDIIASWFELKQNQVERDAERRDAVYIHI